MYSVFFFHPSFDGRKYIPLGTTLGPKPGKISVKMCFSFRVDWMLLYQGMVVLAASQVWWTWEVEDVFCKVQQGEKQAMKNYGRKMHQQIDELVTRITMSLSRNDRKKYNTILIIDVHARDIVDSFIRSR